MESSVHKAVMHNLHGCSIKSAWEQHRGKINYLLLILIKRFFPLSMCCNFNSTFLKLHEPKNELGEDYVSLQKGSKGILLPGQLSCCLWAYVRERIRQLHPVHSLHPPWCMGKESIPLLPHLRKETWSLVPTGRRISFLPFQKRPFQDSGAKEVLQKVCFNPMTPKVSLLLLDFPLQNMWLCLE